jgi:hypothetical protein
MIKLTRRQACGLIGAAALAPTSILSSPNLYSGVSISDLTAADWAAIDKGDQTFIVAEEDGWVLGWGRAFQEFRDNARGVCVDEPPDMVFRIYPCSRNLERELEARGRFICFHLDHNGIAIPSA